MKHFVSVILLLIATKAGAQSSALVMGDSLYTVGNYSKAIEQYQRIKDPSAAVLLQIARAYKGKGVKGTALKFYKATLSKDSLQPIAQTEYGRLLLTRSKFNTADTVFGDLARRFPDNPEYFYQWGRALEGKKGMDTLRLRKKPAINTIRFPEDAYARAVQLDSTHQKALYELSKYHLRHKEYPLVEQLTKKALESDPENVEILGVIAQSYYYKGWYDEAIDYFNTLLDLGINTLFIHDKLGRSYYQKRDYTKAIEHYKEVLQYDDKDWGTLITLARLENFNREYKKAIAYGIKALDYKDLPLDDVYYTLGRSYELKRDFKKAMQNYQFAVKEDPSNFDAVYSIAVVADNYYEDKKEVLKLYEAFVAHFKDTKLPPYTVRLARERITLLKREIFETTDETED